MTKRDRGQMVAKLFISLWVLLLCAPTTIFAHEYQIEVDQDDPLSAEARLTFDSSQETPSTIFLREIPGLPSRVDTPNPNVTPYCETTGAALVRSENSWLVPDACKVVSWHFNFKPIDDGLYDISNQHSIVSDAGWWLFTEWGTFFRIEGNPVSNVCFRSEEHSRCSHVPGLNKAPLMLAVGSPSSTIEVNGFTFDIFGDAFLNANQKEHMESLISNQLERLVTKLTPIAPELTPRRSFDVVFVGIHIMEGTQMGGAGGDAAFISNYGIEDGKFSDKELARLVFISGHELMHTLNILNTQSLWVAESLFSYLSLKSMQGDPIAQQILDETAEGAPDNAAGLVEANSKVVNERDYSFYSLFYDKGVVFWLELDQAIVQASGGEAELETYLSELFNHGMGSTDPLPAEFSAALSGVIGEDALADIYDRYL